MTSDGRLAEAKALLTRLIAFESVSDTSNLPLIDFVEGYLREYKLEARRAPNAAGDKAAILATIGPRVDDSPVALHQGHGIVAEVDDLDRIKPKIAPLVRIGAFRIEGRLDGDFDLMGYSLVHAIVILAAAAPPSTASAVVHGAAPLSERSNVR